MPHVDGSTRGQGFDDQVARRPAALERGRPLQGIAARCGGRDGHTTISGARVLTPAAAGAAAPAKLLRTVGTITGDRWDRAGWLVDRGVPHVAMASTGVFWKPIANLRQGLDLALLVVNAQPIAAVPGRTTEGNEAAWIADCKAPRAAVRQRHP